ncbi:hypothetical protein LCGC14_0497200 [marine sediment metagenome]|uniref:Uncharacterized protein n=2 Tax=root TaxID=1 RepID=A0A9C9NI45_9HYPH|nr:hypothetical protein [Aurantimonas coralicida]
MREIEGIEQALDILKSHWQELEEQFDRKNHRFLMLMSADHDAIGRVLRAHLVVESFLSTFLSSSLGVEDLESLRLSVFQKASLLPKKGSSASFVRPGILQLNAVRNKLGHQIEHRVKAHEISAISEVLQVARPKVQFDEPIDAIEAFAPVACAFLSGSTPELEEMFTEAFHHISTHNPENT